MVSEAQKKATKKYQAKNKERQRVYRYRSYSRKFIKDIANKNDLLELRKMIDDKLKKQ